MIKYAVEEITESLIGEIKPLLEKHWEEIAIYKDVIKFDPKYEDYLLLETNKEIQTITVRDEGVLIGYYVSFIYFHPHYQSSKFSVNDILFIDKSYRGSTVGYRLLKFVEKELRKLGVDIMALHMKVDFPFEKLCEHLGMIKTEVVYSKYLGD